MCTAFVFVFVTCKVDLDIILPRYLKVTPLIPGCSRLHPDVPFFYLPEGGIVMKRNQGFRVSKARLQLVPEGLHSTEDI